MSWNKYRGGWDVAEMTPSHGLRLTINDDGCGADDLVYCGAVTVTIDAADPWDAFVAEVVAREWVGLEALSGLPGTVGEVVAANGHAHGQSVADTVFSVRTWDRRADAQLTLPMVDCEFGPDSSRMSRDLLADGRPRLDVRQVSFLLKQGGLTEPVADAALAALLRIRVGERVALDRVRDRVLEHRHQG